MIRLESMPQKAGKPASPRPAAPAGPPDRDNTTMIKLSDSQWAILSAAAQHEMGLTTAPKTLPAAARNAVFRSLIRNNRLTEINGKRRGGGTLRRGVAL